MSKPPKKKAFETQKKYERRVKAQETVDNYVHQGMKRVSGKQETYEDRCGHCHGRQVMSNGKDCRNCGGHGKILRVR